MSRSQMRSYFTTAPMRMTAAQQKAEKTAADEAAEATAKAGEEKTVMSAEEAEKLRAELATTKKALDDAAKSVTDLKDRLARSYADLENTVRIAKRDVANAKEFGIKGFALKLFDVIDTVELCLENMPKEGLEPGSHLESSLIALESVKKQFQKVMAEYDVQPIEAKVGDKFDANFHNAVFEVPASSPDQQPSSIGVIIKKGWTRKESLLRPTHVGVVMKPMGSS